MAKRISKKNVSKSDLRESLRSVKKSSRLAYFNISEEEIEQNPEKVVKELSHTVAMIPVRQIAPNPDQPRKDFDQEALQKCQTKYGVKLTMPNREEFFKATEPVRQKMVKKWGMEDMLKRILGL